MKTILFLIILLGSTKCFAQGYNCIQTCLPNGPENRICTSKCSGSMYATPPYTEIQTAPTYAFKQSNVQNVVVPSINLFAGIINAIKSRRQPLSRLPERFPIYDNQKNLKGFILACSDGSYDVTDINGKRKGYIIDGKLFAMNGKLVSK